MRRRAAAVVRAALEAERPSESARFEERRRAEHLFIAHAGEPFGEAALDYAECLAAAACQLASTEPLPSPTRVLETLRAVQTSIPPLGDERLVRVAAALAGVAVSPRLELYPPDMDALRALKLAQSTLAGTGRLTAEELSSRLRERYPEAAGLPGRPELDRLIEEAGLNLTWSDAQQAYLPPAPPKDDSSVSLHRQETVVSPAQFFAPGVEVPREIEEALEFERRLEAAYRAPCYLVLAAEPKLSHLRLAEENLSRRYPMEVFNLERELVRALRLEADSLRVRWEVVLRADAAPPDSHDRRNLQSLVDRAVRTIEDRLRWRGRPTLLIYPGLLARYGHLGMLDRLADTVGDHSLWLLAASDRQSAAPTLDGQAIPARPSQWAWIPTAWLENRQPRTPGGRS